MSSAAWADYDVPVAPFFVLVDGASGEVIGEGAANEWGQVQSLLHTALDDAGMLDRRAATRAAARTASPRRRACAKRAPTATSLPPGILPGDPSLYTLTGLDADDPGAAVMTDLTAHGIEVTLPAGWEGRVFRRPVAGEVVGARRRRARPRPRARRPTPCCTSPTIALPPGHRRLRQRRGRPARRRRRADRALRVRRRQRRPAAVRGRGAADGPDRGRLQPERAAADDPRARPGCSSSSTTRAARSASTWCSARSPTGGDSCRRSTRSSPPSPSSQLDATGEPTMGSTTTARSHHQRTHRPARRRRPRPRPRRPTPAAAPRERPRGAVRDRDRPARAGRCR